MDTGDRLRSPGSVASSPLTRYGVTVAAVAAAMLARWLLDPLLGDHHPFATFFAAVAVASWVGGLRTALLATALGFVLAAVFFVPPRLSVLGTSGPHLIGLGMYFVVCLTFAGFGEAMRVARRREAGQKERLRTTLASIGDGVVTTDAAGRVTSLNGVAERLTGWANADARGQPLDAVFAIVNETTRQPVGNPAVRALKEGVVVGLANHTVLIARDGTERPIDDSAAPIRDRDGAVVGCVLVFRDITDRHRADAAVRRSEERFRLAADAVNGIIYEYHLDTGHVERTRGLLEVLGHRPEEVPPTGEWWADQIHPDDRERVARQDPNLAPPGPLMTEYRVRHKDGRWLHVEDRAVLVRDAAGTPVKLVGCTVDVTPRKRAEEELRRRAEEVQALFDTLPVGIFVAHDPEGRTITGNRAAQHLLRTPARNLSLTAPPDELPATFRVCRNGAELPPDQLPVQRAARGEVVVNEEVEVVFADGGVINELISAAPLYDADGRVRGAVAGALDITARRQAEDRLRESESRFAVALQNTRILVYTTDAELRYTWVRNPHPAFDPAVVLGRRDDELLPPEQAEPLVRLKRDVLESGVGRRGEFTVQLNGERSDYDLTVEPLRHDGRCVGVTVAAMEITERKRAEERVRASEERLRLATQATGVGIWEWNVAANQVRWDAQMFRIYGLPPTPDGFIRYDAWSGAVLPEDLPRQEEVLWDTVRRQGTSRREFRIRRAGDGECRVVQAVETARPDAHGQTEWVVGTNLDITDRKRDEEGVENSRRTLHAVVEQCPFGIYIVDDGFRVLTVNAGSQEKTFANVRPVVGRPFEEVMRTLWPEPVAAECIAIFRRTLDTGEPYRSTDFVNPRADSGVTEGYEWEVHRITLPSGRYGAVCYYFDSTRLRLAEQALRDADRRKDVFLATLAHELRNPLAPIRNGLQVIRLAGCDGTVEKARSMMERQLGQMVRLVDDLLDVSRVTTGKLTLSRERVELRAVIDVAVETARPVIEHAAHDFAVGVPDEPIFVDGDVTRLAQAVSNLLTNSAKYTHRGGHIRLTVRREGGSAVVSVRDDGIGIPPAMLDKVFVMFTQVDRTLEKTTGGLGIGLSLVKGLVEMHGGTIEARSEGEGKGSEFVVRLPVLTHTPAGADGHHNRAEEGVPTGRRRILVVDDNADSADSLAQLLELLGNEVRTAYDGQAGVAAAGEFRPAVMLCDIGMPKLNGYEAVRRVRAEEWGKGMVLVALTGWGQDDDRQRSAEAGFDHHLVKPVEFAALTKLLADLRPASA